MQEKEQKLIIVFYQFLDAGKLGSAGNILMKLGPDVDPKKFNFLNKTLKWSYKEKKKWVIPGGRLRVKPRSLTGNGH